MALFKKIGKSIRKSVKKVTKPIVKTAKKIGKKVPRAIFGKKPWKKIAAVGAVAGGVALVGPAVLGGAAKLAAAGIGAGAQPMPSDVPDFEAGGYGGGSFPRGERPFGGRMAAAGGIAGIPLELILLIGAAILVIVLVTK